MSQIPDKPIYIIAPDDFVKKVKKEASHLVNFIYQISDTIPLTLFETGAYVLWLKPRHPTPAVENLAQFLISVDDVELKQGNAEELSSWVVYQWPNEPSNTHDDDETVSNGFLDEQIVSVTSAFLIAPEGNFKEFITTLSSRGISCQIGNIPLNRKKVEAADQIFVWIPESDQGGNYDRVAKLIKEKMRKPVCCVTENTWKDVLAELHDSSVQTQQLAVTRMDSVSQAPIVEKKISLPKEVVDEKIVKKSVKEYVALLKEYASFNMQRMPFEQGFDPESSMAMLVSQINRWTRMVLSYRKGPDQFKPWKSRPCPEGADPETWEMLQQATLDQSKFVLNLLKHRQKCLRNISASEIIRGQFSQWSDVGAAALDYLSYRRYQQLFKGFIDKSDWPSDEESEDSGSFKGLFKTKQSKTIEEVEEAIRALGDEEKKSWQSVVATEFEVLEKDIIERFWKFYEETAVRWAGEKRQSFLADHKRRFLRTGFLGRDISDLEVKHLEILKSLVEENSTHMSFENQEIHAFYFDEFLEHVINQELAPSYDEDLELNGRGTPEWKAARKLRKIATNKRLRRVYDYQIKKCHDRVDQLKKKYSALGLELKSINRRDKQKYNQTKEMHHQTKVALGRVQSFIRKVKERRSEIKIPSKILFEKQFPLDFWIRKEIKHLRAKTRLLNRLKDQYFPRDLKEELDNPVVKPVTPQIARHHFKDILSHDVNLCDLEIVPHKRRHHALIACVPPLIIIAPGGGGDGFCLEPASEGNEGRLFVPMFPRGAEGIREFLVNALSDFRWDSSMVKAGPEWITSNTIVGAYSRCRWEYRNKDKDVREKSLVYKEETDKKNFRRHYRLYEKSADEGGKLLFFKSRIIYENLIPYFVLPEGVKRLDR